MPAHAPSSGDRAIAAVLERARTTLSLPGVGARWVHLGPTARTGEAAFGYRSLDTLERLGDGDAFHLGSDTKAMSATLFMVGVERGALSWNATLRAAFTDTAIHPAYAEAGAPATRRPDRPHDRRLALSTRHVQVETRSSTDSSATLPRTGEDDPWSIMRSSCN